MEGCAEPPMETASVPWLVLQTVQQLLPVPITRHLASAHWCWPGKDGSFSKINMVLCCAQRGSQISRAKRRPVNISNETIESDENHCYLIRRILYETLEFHSSAVQKGRQARKTV